MPHPMPGAHPAARSDTETQHTGRVGGLLRTFDHESVDVTKTGDVLHDVGGLARRVDESPDPLGRVRRAQCGPLEVRPAGWARRVR